MGTNTGEGVRLPSISIKGTTLVIPGRSAVLWEKRFACMGAGTFKRTRAPETAVYLKASGGYSLT